jgi:hypothetical protein
MAKQPMYGPRPGEIRIRRGKRELVAVDNMVTIGDKVFNLSAVDRVIYHAATRINQATYIIGLAQGELKQKFMFDAHRRGTEMEDSRELWTQIVDLLEMTVCPRLADDAVRVISAGGSATFGGPATARIDADAVGIRKRQLFAKQVPWSRVVRSDLNLGQVRVWTPDDTGGAEAGTVDRYGRLERRRTPAGDRQAGNALTAQPTVQERTTRPDRRSPPRQRNPPLADIESARV